MSKPRIFAVYQTGQRHKDYGFFPQKGGVNILRDRWIECLNNLGFDAAWWHNPWGVKANPDGTVAPTNMSVEQKLDAQHEGFEIEVERVTREVRAKTAKPFIHYYGTRPDAAGAPDASLIPRLVTGLRKHALYDSLAAGARIALDAIVDDSVPEMVALAESLNKSGKLAGIEGWPREYAPHLAKYPQIVTSERWQSLYGWPHDGVVPLRAVKRERIVLMNDWYGTVGVRGTGQFNTAKFPNEQCVTPTGGWLIGFVQMWVDSGWSVALPGELFRQRKINVKKWLESFG